MKNLIFTISLLAFSPVSYAQEASAKEAVSRVTVTVIEENGGDRIVKEQSYETGPLSPEQQRVHLDSVLDALGSEGEGRNRRITITLEEGKLKKGAPERTFGKRHVIPHGTLLEFNADNSLSYWDELDRVGRQIDSTITKKARTIERNVNRLLVDIGSRPADFGIDLSDRIEKAGVYAWSDGFFNASKTVRAVSIAPNHPFDGQLNVRFTTREKGDVVITVTDTKGNERAKKELKDFEGEFVGQIKLEEPAMGVLFVSIVQNEDGVTQRVSLPHKD